MTRQQDTTELVTRLSEGDQNAADQLLPVVYEELRTLAGALMRQERSDHTLQATALVNEAYLRLVDQSRVDWQGESHFRAIAARMMYRVLADYARSRKCKKRNGEWKRVALSDAVISDTRCVDVLEFHDVLDRLRELNEQHFEIAQYRLLGNMTMKHTAEALGIPYRTAQREWQMAKAWIRQELVGRNKDDDA